MHHRTRQSYGAHDTPALFAWLVEVLSFQGISDDAAPATWTTLNHAIWAWKNCLR